MNSTEIDLLHYLDKLTIEFGILDSEGNLVLNVDLMDADNNITTHPMKVRDIMYFTEYGTISIPGRFILEKSLQNINQLLDRELNQLTGEILEGGKDKSYIHNYIDRICLKIQNLVRNYMISYAQNNNRLGKIIHPDTDDNKYIFDLNELSKYIRCIGKFEN